MKLQSGVFTLAAIVVVFWELFFFLTFDASFHGWIEQFAHMGDAFNILNALFSGLAFAAICYQLWTQQTQIGEERKDRYRADRISALATLIQITYDKMIFERDLLLKVAPSFEPISFLHEKDGMKLRDAIRAREGLVQSQREQNGISAIQTEKDISDNEKSLPMMRQIAKLIEELQSYEKEIGGLLKVAPKSERDN